MNTPEPFPLRLAFLQRRAWLVGAGGLLLGLVGLVLSPAQFFRSYLFAYLFWLSIAIGCAAVVMIYHLVGGAWGFVIRRLLEAGMRTLPVMAVLFLPLLLGLSSLYEWARPEAVAGDALLQHKSAYLNVPFFMVRAALYFAVWVGIAHFLHKWSLAQDETGDPALARRMEAVSGPGLVLYGGAVTFAAVDWAMSLDPHWFSTIYGILWMVGQVLTALAFVIVALRLLANQEPLAGVLTRSHFHDLGNLLLAFVMLWAYVSFSQFLIIWSGNLTEEIPWYLRRLHGGWQEVGIALITYHFALPFLVLLTRRAKQSPLALACVAGGLLLMRLIDVFWFIAPEFHPTVGGALHLLDVLALVGIGGIWLGGFIGHLKKVPLLPLHDPQRETVVGHPETA
ncbi:MAG: hypothetical protein AB1671_15240 [Thermodesulfobacteriota bacterium]|jgi:hypothetical protein